MCCRRSPPRASIGSLRNWLSTDSETEQLAANRWHFRYSPGEAAERVLRHRVYLAYLTPD
jgi:hypothetical protein